MPIDAAAQSLVEGMDLETALRQCESLWGEAHLMYGDPPLEHIQNAIYVPFRAERSWGLYDKDHKPILEAIDRRGRDRTPHHAIDWDIDEDIAFEDNDEPYMYCGRLNPHYGHFIINTLPKFWPFFKSLVGQRPRILVAEPIMHLQDFASEIFSRLCVRKSDFKWFDRPTRIKSVLIPSPCLLEQYWVYTVFKDLCEQIGMPWWAEPDSIDTPAYFSKALLTSGVGRFVGETIVEECMRKAGVDIFYPERMPLSEQVRTFSERKVCIGPTGSAFHTTIFAPKHRSVICYNPAAQVNSNFALLDLLNENDAQYFYQSGMQYVSNAGGFITSAHLRNPEQLACELLSKAEMVVSWRRQR